MSKISTQASQNDYTVRPGPFFVMPWAWAIVALLEYLLLYSVYPSVNELFSYMKFDLTVFDFGLHALNLLCLFILGGLSVGIIARVNLVITAVPTALMVGFGALSPELGIISLLLQTYFVLLDRNWDFFPSLPNTELKNGYGILIIAGLLSAFVLFYFRGLISFSNLTDVYGNRSQYVESIAAGGSMLTYSKLVVKILIISLAVLAYHNKVFGVLSLAVAIVFYTIFSSKFMLFLPIVIWVFPVIFKNPIYMAAIFGSLWAVFALTQDTSYELTVVGFIRRGFLLPCLLNDIYLTMMHDMGIQYFTTTILSPFTDNDVVLAREANVYLLGDRTSNANTGIIGSGMLQLGYLGPFIYATIYLFLANLNRGYRSQDSMSVSVLAVFILTFLGISDLSTTLVMHGGLVLCLLMRFSSR